SLYRKWIPVGLAIDRAQPLQEYGAVVLVRNAVLAVSMLGLLKQLVESGDGVVILALRLVNDRNVVLHLKRVRTDGSGFLQRFHRLVELPTAPVDLGDAHVGLRVRRVLVGDDLVLLQRRLGLAVVHKVLCQAAHGIEVVLVQLGGAAIGVDRLFVFLL